MNVAVLLPSRIRPDSTAWPADAVTAFDHGDADILVWPRESILGVAEAVAAAGLVEWRNRFTADNVVERVDEAMAALELDCPALADELASIARDFLAQFDLGAGLLRLECSDRAGCPKFHCDNVRVRLIVTCHGGGTEYFFKADPERHEQAPTNALVFLKGHKHPTNACSILHRSPTSPPGERRLVAVFDD